MRWGDQPRHEATAPSVTTCGGDCRSWDKPFCDGRERGRVRVVRVCGDGEWSGVSEPANQPLTPAMQRLPRPAHAHKQVR